MIYPDDKATDVTGAELTAAPDAAEHARTAAEAIRALNHATIARRASSALTYPVDVERTVGELAALAHGLPQALGQLSAWLTDQQDRGLVAIDAAGTTFAGDPATAVATATDTLLYEASPAAEQLAAALDRARAAITYASYAGPQPDEDTPSATDAEPVR